MSEELKPVVTLQTMRLSDGRAALAAKDAEIEKLKAALMPLARLEIPRMPSGNAGAYSIRHSEIKTAQSALKGDAA